MFSRNSYIATLNGRSQPLACGTTEQSAFDRAIRALETLDKLADVQPTKDDICLWWIEPKRGSIIPVLRTVTASAAAA